MRNVNRDGNFRKESEEYARNGRLCKKNESLIDSSVDWT